MQDQNIDMVNMALHAIKILAVYRQNIKYI